MKVMYIYTSRETYPVKFETGEITRQGCKNFSGGWKFVSFRHVLRNEWIPLASIQKNPDMLRSIIWRFKNGNGQWRVRDNDHGTTREWGERVLGVYFGEL